MKVLIDNKEYQFSNKITIQEACCKACIILPNLCYLKDVNKIGKCRMCVVEVVGKNHLVTACNNKICDGMEILTNSKKVIESRKKSLSIILNNHNKNCLSCSRNGSCSLQDLSRLYNVDASKLKRRNNYIEYDSSKCILCYRCVNVCKNIQGINVISKNKKYDPLKKLIFDRKKCIYCGQCVNVCPTGALREKSNINKVIDALNNPKLYKIVAIAPSSRVTLGEEFNEQPGHSVHGKIVTALKMMGFDKVFDINYGADLTIFEEANELLKRLSKNKNLPLITSCCSGWVNYVLKNDQELIPYLSTCKSPQQMFGTICKKYYAKEHNLDPKKMFVLTIMPCTAKESEARMVNLSSEYKDIDCVLTVREFARLIKMYGIDFNDLKNTPIDSPMGRGYSVIFGNSGGVMESALRFAKEKVEGKKQGAITFKEIRGCQHSKEATYKIGDKELNVLVVSGINELQKYTQDIKYGSSKYHFIEVMACPGGCINGGGNPYIKDEKTIIRRRKGLYNIENKLKTAKAINNKDVQNVYKNYLKEPNSSIANEILHRKYEKIDVK